MALLAFRRTRAMVEEPVEGTHSSQDREPSAQMRSVQPKLVTEFEVHERGVVLRIRVERWPSADASDEDTLMEAGYGHGV
jgi:hypothetical protein